MAVDDRRQGLLPEEEEKKKGKATLAFSEKERLLVILTCLGAGNASEAVEVLSLGYILNGLSGTWQSVISSGVYAGMLVGGIVSGFLSDRRSGGGRQVNFLRALYLATIGAIMAALSVHPAMLFVFRVVAGVGVGAATPPLFALAAEVSPPQWRGACITYVAAWWMVGSVFAAGLAKIVFVKTDRLTVDFDSSDFQLWRIYAFICAAPAFLSTIAAAKFLAPSSAGGRASVFFGGRESLPLVTATTTADGDSSSFLGDDAASSSDVETVSDDERRRAWAAAASGGGGGGAPGPGGLLSESSSSREEFDRADSSAAAEGPLAAEGAAKRRSQRRRKLLTMSVTYWGLNFGYYGLATWITVVLAKVGVKDVYGVALLYAGANLPGNVAALALVDKLGRKVLLALAMAGATASALLLAAALEFTDDTALPLTITCAMLFNACTTAGWGALDALTAESFNKADRATALGILNSVGRVASIAAQYVNGSLASIPALLLTVTAAFMFLGTLAVGGLRELKNVQID
mmetsp:Transcript_15745/g.51458  ORF Transcript_15745/g.51458 Transcript_15745/m.51458 type:complete len:519 (-) Transcript_15745:341-1897(-)|eukprot:CAMPEP_0118907306 /NCGR_PEP_ID=MMETSP1166-20130328/10813_1 /TAXON_ID=1104430 /ORGANISM="Chrysoreinhardia sp, Strain CCMP3193" /LENGTH=518 /DNA_ID=CAMNT_0006846669 /DNA_START=11 /DNA_END=1567 /DNA_ORIENTATION=-